MATNWNCDFSRKFRCILTVLFVLLCSSVTWAENGQAPTIITLVPVDVTSANATLRAEVTPNGLPTEVEFLLHHYYDQRIIPCGKVSAGSGSIPLVVELRVTGLPPADPFWIEAKASNAAGSSTGYEVHFQLCDTGEFYDFGRPSVALLSVKNITERSATVEVEVNPMGNPDKLVVSVGAEYAIGSMAYGTGAERTLKGVREPVRVTLEITGLWRGFTYRLVTGHAAAYYPPPVSYQGAFGSGGPSLTTLGEPGHNPPEFDNVALRVPIGAVESFTRLVAPFDPDGDTFSIESISQPLHGTVTVEAMEWTYTPDSSYDGSDQFSVTVVDSKGERATRIVQIYDVRPKAFEFDLPLNWNVSDPPRPAGTLKLSTTVAGAFTGKASIFGEDYTLRSSFDQFQEAVLELNRKGLPPLVATLKLVPGVDGEMHLSADIQAPELGSSYVAEGLPVGNAETSEGVAGLRYTAVLPMQEGAVEAATFSARSTRAGSTDTPQGDGFLIGTVDRSGRARFTGRTGDGQTFTVGGRLQRNRQLQVGISTGKQPRDYIVGHLEFNRDDTKSIGGSLGWLSYRSQKEYYARDFSRVAELKGAAYRKPKATMNLFGEAGGSSELRVRLLNDAGAPVVDSAVSVSKSGSASLSGGYGLKLHLDRNSGLFRGTLNGGGVSSKTSFMGALVQPLKRGQGHLLLNGPVGAVMIAAPEQ